MNIELRFSLKFLNQILVTHCTTTFSSSGERKTSSEQSTKSKYLGLTAEDRDYRLEQPFTGRLREEVLSDVLNLYAFISKDQGISF